MKKNPEDLRTAASHKGVDYIDYRETSDVTDAHAAVEREHSIGVAGSVPVPLWLIGFGFAVAIWAGAYLGMFSGGFSSENYNPYAGMGVKKKAAGAGGDAGQQQALSPLERGKKLYAQNCASCHQANGQGAAGQYPTLVGSEYVVTSPKRLAMILLKGVQGPLKVKGQQFNGAMPAWQQLTDDKIAAITTYIRQEWGNNASAITPEQIASARKEYAARTEPWAEADLLAVPEDAPLEGGGDTPPASPAAGASPAAAAVTSPVAAAATAAPPAR